ncbi:MAG: uracil-DNA glycosylase [Cytophagales bacterium]|nr:MAG: uracil-DNA glycosylase [Cytophagales bacterium]TAF60953.1 MAG: uracil-DNA glycosylase [Cytophagales bacterium]
MSVQIHDSWKSALKSEFEKDYFKTLIQFVKKEYQTYKIYPSGKLIFNAFDLCPLSAVKVVIIGQDPYHGPDQAHGLSFSVNDGVRKPPSLLNIFKELHDDLLLPIPVSGNLERWAQQGVLLLNATLTVRANEAGSHQKKGWETFTDAVVKLISEQQNHVVFMLWGRYAQDKGAVVDKQKHLVLEAVHPSPLAQTRGSFLGCKHFSKANDYLKIHHQTSINW